MVIKDINMQINSMLTACDEDW